MNDKRAFIGNTYNLIINQESKPVNVTSRDTSRQKILRRSQYKHRSLTLGINCFKESINNLEV